MKKSLFLPACALAAALAFVTSSLTAQATDSSHAKQSTGVTRPSTTTTTATATTGPAAAISDSAIIAMLELSDQQEIAAAELASTHAKSDRVKQYAERLHTDHTKSLQELQRYAERMRGGASAGLSSGVPPDSTKVGVTVRSDTTRVTIRDSVNVTTRRDSSYVRHDSVAVRDTTATRRDSASSGRDMSVMSGRRDSSVVGVAGGQPNPGFSNLQTLSGHEFDHGFIELEVQGHQDEISKLRNDFIPMIKDSGLKTLVQGMLPTLGSHLREAQELQRYLKTVN
jgi:predicted outer membrane protein